MTSISVIIPALNEADFIALTLMHVTRAAPDAEVIVVDGGSTDQTVALARRHGAATLSAPRGRGSQLAAGAARASGEILWFLHADTSPPPAADQAVRAALASPDVAGGCFRPRFDGEGRAARFLTWLYPHLGQLGLRYGDAGLFFRRDIYDRVGGFRPYPIFEDLDLLRRVAPHGRIVALPQFITTSSRRFEQRNFAWIFARWTCLQLLFWLRVPPPALARLYGGK